MLFYSKARKELLQFVTKKQSIENDTLKLDPFNVKLSSCLLSQLAQKLQTFMGGSISLHVFGIGSHRLSSCPAHLNCEVFRLG